MLNAGVLLKAGRCHLALNGNVLILDIKQATDIKTKELKIEIKDITFRICSLEADLSRSFHDYYQL